MPIVNFEDMKHKKASIIGQFMKLAQQIDQLNSMGLAVDGQVLIDLKTKLENDNFKVLVIGEFKNGKSTFINALLGDKILPAYSTPCTAVINEVKYGNEKKAMLFFKNPLPEEMSEDIQESAKQHIKMYEGQEIPPIELDVSQLVNYVAIPDPTKDQADSISELPFSKVVLEYPIEICHDGIEIIDSPGLNENGTRTKVTEEYLNNADAILFVFRCPKIAGKSEMEFIQNQIHTRGHRDIFFICNGINQVQEEEQERLIQFGKAKLASQTNLKENGVFYLNALGALTAKQNKDFEKLKQTGMDDFEAALSEYLRNNKGKTKLLQIIDPCLDYIDMLKNQIQSYRSLLNQNFEELEKRIKDASPKLKFAEDRKELLVKKIGLAMEELKKKIKECMDIKYGSIISNVPTAIDKMKLDNHMTVNPFKQKEKKEALEKEVISKLEVFIQREMGEWIKMELKQLIDEFIDDLQTELDTDIDIFYENLDDFRYAVSGVKKPKDISGFGRVSATILGTIVGGPTYGMLGASLGFGEIAKRSAITMGASFTAGAILAFTPLGLAAITTGTTIACLGAGIVQIATGGKALEKKYKKQLTNSFIDKLKETREESCDKYASNIVEDVRTKFDFVVQALDNEIGIEKSKIEALRKDKEKSEEERKDKEKTLVEICKALCSVEEELGELERRIK